MPVNKLDKLYICQQCKSTFLFHSDAEEHEQSSGHGQFETIPLEVDAPEKYK
jgi:hypothetical protein